MVYIIMAGHFPYGMAPIKRTLCLAKSLIYAGGECKILIFAGRDNRTAEEGKGYKSGVFEGVPFEFIGRDVGTTVPLISNVLSLISMLKLLRYLRSNLKKNDVVYSYVHDKYTTQYMNFVIRIVHGRRAKYVRELCELPFGKKKETSKTVTNRKKILEKQFPKYDGVLAISQSLVDLAQKYVNPLCRIYKLPILVEFEKYSCKGFSGVSDMLYIFHSGTLTEQKDGILGMIEAFGKACQQLSTPLKFISTGRKENSEYCEQINKLIEQYHIEGKVVFLGFIDDEVLMEYLWRATLVIINKYPTQQNNYCFSTKLGEYMAAGKPVVITDVGEAMNWLTNREDSLIVPTQNIDALAGAIVELISNIELRERIGSNARVTCQKAFDYRSHGKQLREFFLFD